MASGPLQLTFVTSAPGVAELPPTRREVALVGRSNVGKSSLLNALAGRKNLARTSKTPGRTQLLNVFAMEGDPNATVVDLPGYGYAKAPRSEREAWQRRMHTYLAERAELAMICVLVDGEVGPTKLDVEMLDFLRARGRPWTVVATKHDKVKSSTRTRRKRDLAAGCGVEQSDVVWVSADRNVNIDRLRDLVRGWLAGA